MKGNNLIGIARFKNVNNFLDANIYTCLETSGANVIKQYRGKLPW